MPIARLPNPPLSRFGNIPQRSGLPTAVLAVGASTVVGLTVVQRGPKLGVAMAASLAALAVVSLYPRRILLAVGSVAMMFAIPRNLALGPSAALAWRFTLVLGVGYLALTLLSDRSRNLRWTLADRALVLYVGVVLLSWVLRAPDLSWEVVLLVVSPAPIYAMARAIPAEQTRIILWTALIACSAGAVTVLIEFAAGRIIFSSVDPTAYAWKGGGVNVFRAAGVFGSPPSAAAALLSTALASYPLYFSRNRGQALLAQSLGLIVVVAGVVVFTRAPLIGFLIGAGLLIILRTRNAREARTTAFVVALSAIAILQFATTINAGFARSNNTFAQRQGFWASSVPLITDSGESLLLGHGPLNLLTRLRTGQSVPASMGVGDLASWSVHNYFLQVAIDTGLLGTILALAWLVFALAAGASETLRTRYIRPPPATYALGPALLVYVGGMMASALFTGGDMYPLALWAGLAVSAAQRATLARTKSDS